ncbi:hypothetical protein Agub_g479 [Astrephomene gubernaculifera]|uniref:Uncharacterized protein n=1 Tax=Astrephomene gubernaculifera TaxID=47775 RepID=A0AAD3DGK9_9CHLO|nr:hypothetical protein Agub_g479 [Astrephomene gubernaculifera]
MKTFTRKRKSAPLEEPLLTNGTNVDPKQPGNVNTSYYDTACADTPLQLAAGAAQQDLVACSPASAPAEPLPNKVGKRKLEEDAPYVTNKESRVETPRGVQTSTQRTFPIHHPSDTATRAPQPVAGIQSRGFFHNGDGSNVASAGTKSNRTAASTAAQGPRTTPEGGGGTAAAAADKIMVATAAALPRNSPSRRSPRLGAMRGEVVQEGPAAAGAAGKPRGGKQPPTGLGLGTAVGSSGYDFDVSDAEDDDDGCHANESGEEEEERKERGPKEKMRANVEAVGSNAGRQKGMRTQLQQPSAVGPAQAGDGGGNSGSGDAAVLTGRFSRQITKAGSPPATAVTAAKEAKPAAQGTAAAARPLPLPARAPSGTAEVTATAVIQAVPKPVLNVFSRRRGSMTTGVSGNAGPLAGSVGSGGGTPPPVPPPAAAPAAPSMPRPLSGAEGQTSNRQTELQQPPPPPPAEQPQQRPRARGAAANAPAAAANAAAGGRMASTAVAVGKHHLPEQPQPPPPQLQRALPPLPAAVAAAAVVPPTTAPPSRPTRSASLPPPAARPAAATAIPRLFGSQPSSFDPPPPLPSSQTASQGTGTGTPSAAAGRASRPIGRGLLPSSSGPLGTTAAGGTKAPLASSPSLSRGGGPDSARNGGAAAAGGSPGAGRQGSAALGGRQRAGSAMSAGGGGGGGGRVRGGSQGDDDAAAAAASHSIVEAQERGELLQLQDDALYALDGLKAAAAAVPATTSVPGGAGGSCGAGTAVREPAAALAAILATRRGRAALSRPTNLAQQALTSLARTTAVPRDPVAALAAAVILLALVQEDALPAYGASYAAAVLMRQVLQQAESDAPPILQPPSSGAEAGGGGGSSWKLLTEALAAAGGAGIGGGGAGGDAIVRRLSKLFQEGHLARQVGRPELVMSPLPLVLRALVTASGTAPARIHFAERLKDNMHKVGILPLLARLIAARRDAIVRHLNRRPDK